MAEAFARMHGEGILEPQSAGSHPSGIINPGAISIMEEVGYDLSKHRSKSIEQISHNPYDVVVTMGCGDDCGFLPATRKENWDLPDPSNMEPDEFRRIRDCIENLIKRLVDQVGP